MINQEILFRGFRPCEDGDTNIYVENKTYIGQWVYWNEYGELTEPLLDDFNMHSHVSEFDVIPSTVCEYTGLNDKNGMKIFKGDIIQANFKTPFVVEWDSDGCRFLGVQPNDGSRHFTASEKYVCYLNDAQEVIGTIFDKPKEATK